MQFILFIANYIYDITSSNQVVSVETVTFASILGKIVIIIVGILLGLFLSDNIFIDANKMSNYVLLVILAIISFVDFIFMMIIGMNVDISTFVNNYISLQRVADILPMIAMCFQISTGILLFLIIYHKILAKIENKLLDI